jgi:cobaltochelatase CobN
MHLLAVETGTLDEVENAVDLGQTPGDIVVLSFSDSDLSALAASFGAEPLGLPSLRLASLKKLRHPLSVDLYVEKVIAAAKLVIVRSLGGLDYWRYGFERIAAVAREKGSLLVALPGDDRPDPRLAALSTVPVDALDRFDRYFREGGPDNARNLLRFAAHLLGRRTDYADPSSPGPAIAVAADGRMLAIDDVPGALQGQAAALVVFYRSSLLAADFAPVVSLMQGLEQRGLRTVGLAVTSLKDAAVAPQVAAMMARLRPDVILNATAFSALRADDTTVLDAADCAVIQVALAGHPHDAWDASMRGLSPTDLAMNVVLPELDGRVFSRAISFKADQPVDDRIEYSRVVHEPVADRVSYVADLAAAWARLRRTPADRRRIAVMLSDYPGRGGRAGYACGLDTPESAAEILSMLAAAGYDTGARRPEGREIIERLSGLQEADEIAIPANDYRAWLAAMPESMAGSIDAAWGAPESDPLFSEGCFRFRCVKAGNVLLLLQPDRGSVGDRKTGYHDTTVPPRHAYVALYAWLREACRLDALVHLGTHGTLEWLPGKAVALSRACAPEAVLGPVPVIYPFIVNNPGEAVQAKRRIAAVTIGHLTPPLSEAGLHGPLGELEGLIEEYSEADGVDRRRVAILEKEILERAWRSGLAADCGLHKDDAPREAIAKLDAQLCDIKDLAIRDRLHVFGREPDETSRADLASAIMKASGGADEPDTISRLLADCAVNERASLLAALDGRRVAPGPAGAPTRGRRDVLPTGRNLATIDPRAVPTRTATIVGTRAADEVVRRHLQDHGDYPRALVLDLWASASLRTGGDDLAQAFAYLGVRPRWDHASNRVTGVEVLPMAKLERPRIDVTLRISGSFRDIFPAQIALFDLAVQMVAERDEPDDFNPLAAARRKGESLARVFGSAPGTYGAGAAEVALDSIWTNRDDLAKAYMQASSHAYGRDDNAEPALREFEARVAAADALVHPQDDRERDLLDGDGVADFAGGFAAAAASLGRSPALYHLDSSKPEAPVARTIGEEIVRIARGRLTNPRWIAGMLKHGHRGVSEMAQGVDALYTFAVSAEAVPSHVVDSVHDAFIADETTLAALLEANAPAARAIAQRLQDLISRGLWVPRRNAVHGELARVLDETGVGSRERIKPVS